LDLSNEKEIQDRIIQEYNANITVQDYQLVKIKYHENYAESYLGEPIQYFVE